MSAGPRRGRYEEYHPYGSTAWWAGDFKVVSQKRYRYTGMERDEETGLQCHGVRYYATWLGRWTSADPIGLGDGVDRFAYCHGNPVILRDPTGMDDAPAPDYVEVARSGMDPLRVYRDNFFGPLPAGAMRQSEYDRVVASDGPVRPTSFTGPVVGLVADPLAKAWAEHSVAGQGLQLLAEKYPDQTAAVAKAIDSASQSPLVLAAEDAPLVKFGTSLLRAGGTAVLDGLASSVARREITTLTGQGAKIAAADVLKSYKTGSFFSGVFNPQSGRFLAMPSAGAELLSGEAVETVARRGGDTTVEGELMKMIGGGDRGKNAAFTLQSLGGNRVSIEWESGVNLRNFDDRTLPEVLGGVRVRDQVISALKAAGLDVVGS